MIVTISNQFTIAKINTKGAELNSLIKNDREFMWQGNPEFWGKHSPILFPIVGTLKNDTFIYDQKQFQLSRHGFARDNEFEIEEQKPESVTFLLKSSSRTEENYPFQFELRVIYTLEGNNLNVKYQVENKSETSLPFSIGGHPAFSLPENFENYSLEFKNDLSLKSYFLKNDLLSDEFQNIDLKNNSLNLNYALFENDALILKKLESKSITVFENKKPLFNFEYNDFPNFGIWTKENAPFICLEPWFGYSDKLETTQNILEKEGIIILDKNNSFSASFSVVIY